MTLDFSVRHGAIIQYDIKPKRYSEFYLDLSLFYIDKENIAIEEQAIVSIVKTPFNSKIGCSPKLNKHMKDTLLIVDKEDKKVLHRIDTRQRERLLYADSSRAITYYEGTLYTYDVDSWNIIKTTDASFITRNKEYYFETCHDKLFVFENGSLVKILDFVDLL